MSQQDLDAMRRELDSFDPHARREALEELHTHALAGDLPVAPTRPEVNLHFHTFFSYNARGWSPTRIAWESYVYGLEAAGIVDFDVLAGMDEFLRAGDLLRLKAVAGIESRVFVSEYADQVLNSPNEPGVAYFMGVGCFDAPLPHTDADGTLALMLEVARSRTLGMMERLDEHMPELALEFERDVAPLTPAGNATERHLLAAYDARARRVFPDEADRIDYWARKLGLTVDEVRRHIDDAPKFHETVRAKLMKFGGVGYVPPHAGSFPAVEAMIDMVLGIGALPAYAWLDGTSNGEQDIDALLDLMVDKGVVAMNIIPDRNWNYKDAKTRRVKLEKLHQAVAAARARDLPLVVGTEMNKAGLPFVDDFSAPELAPFVADFLDGARVVYGHTLLARFAELGYWSRGVQAAFGDDRKAKNEFFAAVGRHQPPTRPVRDRLRQLAGELEPHAALDLVASGD